MVVVYGRIKWSHEIRGNRGVGEWLEPTDALRHVDAIRARVVHHCGALPSDLLPSTRKIHQIMLILFSASLRGVKIYSPIFQRVLDAISVSVRS